MAYACMAVILDLTLHGYDLDLTLHMAMLLLQKLQGACGLDVILHFTATTEAVLERASALGW